MTTSRFLSQEGYVRRYMRCLGTYKCENYGNGCSYVENPRQTCSRKVDDKPPAPTTTCPEHPEAKLI